MPTLYAGTSGFAYPAWKPAFYPAKLPSKQFLGHYASRLNCVEINYTFRRLPAAATLESWASQTPAGFLFALKANQRITHILRLKNAEQATEIFLKAIDPLRAARRLGPILFQLPPQLKCDLALLRDYLALLPAGEALPPGFPGSFRYAFEFRHQSWLADSVYAELQKRNISLCVAESEKLEIPEILTADFVYFRLRKPDYTAADIAAFAGRARELLAAGRDLYLFFKHEDTPEGAWNAEKLLQIAAPGA
ncbi:MAG TPA: DUF72 domain-containing protein [Bryobacteraceae bacterium]|nr:DUF72 domain-containing protein [Bryobacteraceae bacterium]